MKETCRCGKDYCLVHASCGHRWEQTKRGDQEGTYICPACDAGESPEVDRSIVTLRR